MQTQQEIDTAIEQITQEHERNGASSAPYGIYSRRSVDTLLSSYDEYQTTFQWLEDNKKNIKVTIFEYRWGISYMTRSKEFYVEAPTLLETIQRAIIKLKYNKTLEEWQKIDAQQIPRISNIENK